MTLEEFKKLCAEDIKGLSEKKVLALYEISKTFAEYAFKKWIEQKILKQK